MPKVETVDSYIANSPEETRSIMQELRDIITSTIPKAEEGISWNVPIYKYHGILGGFSVAKKHISFGVDALLDEDRALLKENGYKTGKKTIQIKFDQPVPIKTIKKTLIEQAKRNEMKIK